MSRRERTFVWRNWCTSARRCWWRRRTWSRERIRNHFVWSAYLTVFQQVFPQADSSPPVGRVSFLRESQSAAKLLTND